MMVDPCHYYSLRLCLKGRCVFVGLFWGLHKFYVCLARVSEVCEDYGRLWIVW